MNKPEIKINLYFGLIILDNRKFIFSQSLLMLLLQHWVYLSRILQ